MNRSLLVLATGLLVLSVLVPAAPALGAAGPGPVYLPLLVSAGALPGMVYIPAGTFQMGCDTGNPSESCYDNEKPLHTVYLSAYYMDKTEVTNA